MADLVSIQWFPGHMAKTRRIIKESLSMIDCVAEIVDARIPQSSRNPEIDEICSSKPKILILNKSDVADPDQTAKWVEYYKKQGIPAIVADCKVGKGLNRFIPEIKILLKDLIQRYNEKGMTGKKLRVMVVGIPNCGKSTFINRMAGSNKLKTEDRPGVTRARQWIDLSSGVEMMDTPGMLWPKFEDPLVGEKLAFCGAVKDDVTDTELLARRLLEVINELYPNSLIERYKLKGEVPKEGAEILEKIAIRRGMRISGGEVDTERASTMILDEFRSGKLGRMTLERPEEKNEL